MATAADVDPFEDWPERTPLYGDDGKLLLVFTLAEGTRDDRPWVDIGWRPPTAAAERVRDAVLDAFAGHAFTSLDPSLAEALLAAGATELRHAHSMSHSLDPLPESVSAEGLDVRALPAAELIERADELGRVNLHAYPASHPDHEHTEEHSAAEEMRQFARGEVLGPYLDVSTVATVDGSVVGACLVVQREGEPPKGGPWVVDVFRDPAVPARGVGRALLVESLHRCKAAGLSGLSLVVSDTNASARRVYRRLGFADGLEAWTLALP